MIDKKLLRKIILDYRRLLAPEEYQKRNASLCEQALDLVRSKDFKTIHCFLPIAKNKEPDFTPIFENLWSENRRIMVSQTDFAAQSLSHFWLTKETKLVENNWGIPEPVDAEPAQIHEADLILVPLVAADKKGNRIGYGGGFYDRLLVGYAGASAGVCISPLLDNVGTDEWDMPVKQVLFFEPS